MRTNGPYSGSPNTGLKFMAFYDDSLCAAQGYAYRLAQYQTDSTQGISQIIVYPNPSQAMFTVYTGTQHIEALKILHVYNALGQVVLTKKASGSQVVLDFAAEGLAKGVYTLHISIPSAGITEYKKLIYAR